MIFETHQDLGNLIITTGIGLTTGKYLDAKYKRIKHNQTSNLVVSPFKFILLVA